ncbi:hypothetical protein [Arthrobacter methylotrophus]
MSVPPASGVSIDMALCTPRGFYSVIFENMQVSQDDALGLLKAILF